MANSIYDLYEFYLEARDLKEKAHLVKVQSVKVESIYNAQNGKKDQKICLRFENRRKGMLLNKTQAGAMFEVTGKDDYTKWVGAEVVLVAGRAKNGKQTIVITDRAGSGDIDLMYPQKLPNVARPGWVEALHNDSVTMAANRWGMSQAEAWKKLNDAINDERMRAWLPESEFKEYVEMVAVQG